MHINKKAFTLIELLVVVLIIGILAAIALPQYQKVVRRSRVSEAITMLNAILKRQEEYYLIYGKYTDNIEDLSITAPSGKLIDNMSVKDKKSNYYYYCFSKRTCVATMDNLDYPIFEFHTDRGMSDGIHSGKRWCQIADGGKNQNARDICAMMGTIDPIMGGNYYLLK
jgi:prepilin-type N-terminal cleavage/methylation domain-containing protein